MATFDEYDFRYGKDYLNATDEVLLAIAKFLAREEEFEAFRSRRKKLLNSLNGLSTDLTNYSYEDYIKSVPYWVKAVEAPIVALYEQGMKDAAKPAGEPPKSSHKRRRSKERSKGPN